MIVRTTTYRHALRAYGERALDPGLERSEIKELREATWEQAVQNELARTGRADGELLSKPKRQDWKIALASEVRRLAAAPISWLAKRLALGNPSSLRSYLWSYRSRNRQKTA